MKSVHLSPEATPLRALPPMPALLAFARAGAQLSFRRAARDLALSPSAVSHQIRGLEERFGVRLFARGVRSVRLTAEGEQYLQAVIAALATLDEASRMLLRRKQGRQHELHVSSLPLFTSTVLLPALATFERRNPGLTLRIDATHSYADFDDPSVDVAIRYGRERAEGLRREKLIEVHTVPVCAPMLVRGGLRQVRDLERQVLIHLAPQPRAWPMWLEAAGVRDLMPRGELWLDTMPAAIEAAEHGLGVALALHPVVRARRGFGTALVAPFDVLTDRGDTLYLMMRPQQARDRRIVAFRRWLLDAIRRATQA